MSVIFLDVTVGRFQKFEQIISNPILFLLIKPLCHVFNATIRIEREKDTQVLVFFCDHLEFDRGYIVV